MCSEVDKDSLHANLADEVVCIGANDSQKSYLNIKSIIEAAYQTGADAIHPGFGFLSENSEFAKICQECNLKFIGPNYNVIKLLGNKSNSKKLAKEAGIPVIPGSDGSIVSKKEAKKLAKEIGYPILLKAANGGGGKGIRIVKTEEEFDSNYNLVKMEAQKAFKDQEIYLEKYIEGPRHIEIQILADEHGNIVHLGERDCSIQRKNQKIIEESPSNYISEKIRAKMGEAAKTLVSKAKYTNAGTIEFLVDKDKKFYFMEMNTRLQVEHPVTEMVNNIDIVKWQIKIASGQKLDVSQKDIKPFGHSIECRINAEDPSNNFIPCPGKIENLHLPGGNGIRVDSHIYSGSFVPPYYDSMIAKIIVHGTNRQDAIAKMKSAIGETIIEGIKTNTDFLFEILGKEEYISGNYDTNFIDQTTAK